MSFFVSSQSKDYLQMICADLLEKLKAFDTPTICNAMELIDSSFRRSGFTTQQLVAPFPDMPPMVGYARTASIRSVHAHELDSKAQRAQRIGYYEYIAEAPNPQIVVIQDLDGPDIGYGAFWGEVQSTIHKALGCVGVVTDGCIRDIPQWAPGLNVLAGSIKPSHAHVHLADFGKEVRVAGMLVRSNDLIHADQHGAVVIPEGVAEKLPAACDLMARKEAVILDLARKPGFTVAMLREALAKQDEIH